MYINVVLFSFNAKHLSRIFYVYLHAFEFSRHLTYDK